MREYPWYDSWWLASYAAARELLREQFPAKLDDFEARLAALRTRDDFNTVERANVLSTDELAELRRIIKELKAESLEKHELFRFGRHVVHNHEYLTRLQASLTAMVSEAVGEAVEPSYNFLSLYNNLAVCEPHMDSLDAKWTLDVCIDQSWKWPIHISQVRPWPVEVDGSAGWGHRVRSDPDNRFSTYTHTEGSGLIFAGSSQWHYRDRISKGGEQNFSHLAFFHFIPAGTRELVDPRKWAKLFNIPQIASVVTAPNGETTPRAGGTVVAA